MDLKLSVQRWNSWTDDEDNAVEFMLFHKKQITAFLDISSVNKPNKYLAFLCEEEAQSKQGGFLQEATILALS